MVCNFFILAFIGGWGIQILKFIALEGFNGERFHGFARGIGIGLYFAGGGGIRFFGIAFYCFGCFWFLG